MTCEKCTEGCALCLGIGGTEDRTPPGLTELLLRKHYGRERNLEHRMLTELCSQRWGVITRLREALNELERWQGYAMPDHVARILEPGDLYDLEPLDE